MNPFIPKPVKITDIRVETGDVKTFRLDLRDFSFVPGQFIELSCLGFGEFPVSISSTPTQRDFVEVSVKNLGRVTSVLHEAVVGDSVGVRGPYGNGFPVKELRGRDLLFIGGGIGLAPLRSFINYVSDSRSVYGNVSVLYGARSPDDLVFREELDSWRKKFDVHLTIDCEAEGWSGCVGFVHGLLGDVEIDPKKMVAVVCGPSVMMKSVVMQLKSVRFPDKQILLSFERVMKCGVGKCGHCNFGDRYVCIDGPVFNYNEVKGNPELWE